MTTLAPLSPIVGRESERAQIEQAFAEGARLCTLVGPGGIGKTFLAIDICRRIDGVFCDLSAAHSEDEALATIAAALDAARADGPIDRAIEAALTNAAPSVLVLDNVEQIGAQLAPRLRRWLSAVSPLTILATSRERIGIEGESLHVIDALSTRAIDARSPAAELFARRARAHGARSVSDADAEAVAAALEGVPLAIELAAARARTVGITALIDARDGLLDALRSVRRDTPSRHETLRRTIDWSWDRLAETEREAFAACGVFRGAFDHAACCAVLSEEPARASRMAQTLVERSLLRALEDGRFALFETLRAYADERLIERGERDAVLARHRRFFAARARRAIEAFERNASEANLAAIERDRDNLAILARDDAHPREALAALVALDPLARLRATLSGREEALTRALSRDCVEDALRVAALRARARARLDRGAIDEARADLDAAYGMAIAIDQRSLAAQISVELGVLAQQRRELDDALAHYRSAQQSALEVDDALMLARVEANIAAIDHDRGDFARATSGYRAALAKLSLLDVARIEGITRSNLALALLEQSATSADAGALREDAERQFDRASALLEASGDRRLFAINEGNRALLAHAANRLLAAQRCNTAAAELLATLGDVRSEGLCRARLGGVLAELGELDAARRELGRAEALLERADDRYGLDALALYRALLSLGEARREALARPDPSIWTAARDAARSQIDRAAEGRPETRSWSDDVRLAAQIVRRAMETMAPESARARADSAALIERDARRSVLRVGEQALWFQLDEQPMHDVRAYGPLRRVLEALIEARASGAPKSIEALFDAGWPAERAIASAANNRVHVCLSDLRRRGLRPWIVQRDGRYALSDTLVVERASATFAEPAAPTRRGARRRTD